MVEMGVHQNGFFYLFWLVQTFGLYILVSLLYLGQVLVITYVISLIFPQIQWHILKSKKGSLVHLGWVKYIWVNSHY